MSGTLDKVKNALHLNKDHSSTTHTTSTHNNTTGTGVGHSSVGGGITGAQHGVTSGTGTQNTAGPHSSNLANKADPRVDSDLDGSRNLGAASGTTGTGFGSSNTTGTTGYGSSNTAGTTGYGSNTTAGPHSSNLANKVDPRVDSDRDGSTNFGATTGAAGTTGTYSGTHAGNTAGGYTGTTGGLSSSTNAGPHDSNLANKVDPRVDSDLDGRGNRHGAATGGILGTSGSHATAGSGTAQNTAGPHNSDLANKLDPRVDADRDGSKTYGGNKTHA